MFNKILAVINNIHLTPKGKADAILALEVPGKDYECPKLCTCAGNVESENCPKGWPLNGGCWKNDATIADLTEVK